MRKILTSFALVAASLAFAQVGVNNDTPQATLDVKAKAGKVNGILVPRVTKAEADAMPNPEGASKIEESTLIYVEGNTSANLTNYAENVKTPGFYYFKDGKWVSVAPGSAGTGAKVQAFGSSNDPETGTTITLKDDVDLVIYTPESGDEATVNMTANNPDGRKVCIFNNSNIENLNVLPQPRGQNSILAINAGACFVSWNNKWFGMGYY